MAAGRICVSAQYLVCSLTCKHNTTAFFSDSLNLEFYTELRSDELKRLDKALGNVRTIRGYLRLSFAQNLRTLSFLSNLRRIEGNELYDG